MKTIKTNNLPHNLETRLKELANKHNRSLNAQIIAMLSSVADDKQRVSQADALKSIYSRRFSPPQNAPSSLKLLSEDRTR